MPTLEVDNETITSSPGLALANNDGGGNLLPELRLSLLDCGEDHISETSLRKAVQASTPAGHSDDVQVLGATVVGAVHHGSDGETASHPEFVALGSSSS